jgi:hypothetical protein
MFVTSDRAVFDQCTAKNATLIKEPKNQTDKDGIDRSNRSKQILINLLVQGIHRDRQGYKRGQNTQHQVGKEDWENITGFPDDDDDVNTLFAELEQSMSGNFEALLEQAKKRLTKDIVPFPELRDAFRLIKQASKTAGADQDQITQARNQYADARATTKAMFKDTKGKIQMMRDRKDEFLADPAWNQARIDREIADNVKKMNDLQPNSGDNFLYKLNMIHFVDTPELQIKRCQACADNNRFPMTLVTYDARTFPSVRFTTSLRCTCFSDPHVNISKLIFMPDVIAKYLQLSQNTKDKKEFAPLFLININDLFIQNPECTSFKLQFMYLTKQQYLSQHVYVGEPTANVHETSSLQTDPFDALSAYFDAVLDENVEPDQLASAIDPLLSQQSSTGFRGYVRAAWDMFSGVGSSQPVSTSVVEMPTTDIMQAPVQITRSSNRKNTLYNPLQDGIMTYLKETFSQTPIIGDLEYKVTSGNTRLRLSIDATIRLRKTPTAQRFIIVSPQRDPSLTRLMSQEIAFLGDSEQPQMLKSSELVRVPEEPLISRLIISDDADGLTSQHIVSATTVTQKFSNLLRKLEINGLAVLLNHNMSPKDTKNFSTYYSYKNNDKIQLTAMNFPVNDAMSLLFFYSKRSHTISDLPVLQTRLCGDLNSYVFANHGNRIIRLGPQSVSPPVVDEITTQETQAPFSLDFEPATGDELAEIIKELQEEKLPSVNSGPVSLEPLELPLSLPSPLIGSRLWRSGTQLALMMRS